MTGYKTLTARYSGKWRNSKEDCPLCEMEKKTEWHLETNDWVIAEKLGGGPFIVYKRHTDSLSDDEWDTMERVVSLLFNEFEITVHMGMVEDHWHGHILTDEQPSTK